MKKFFLFITLAASGLFFGCKNDLELLAPYKESVSVFALLNPNDSVQYLRVDKVFLGEGNAYTMAMIKDSAYFKPGEITVKLERYLNNVRVFFDSTNFSQFEVICSEIPNTINPGVFNPNQLLYKTNRKIYRNSEYKLIITKNSSGKTFTARTKIVYFNNFPNGSWPTGSTVNPIAPLNLSAKNVVAKYNSMVNAGICGLKLRLYYTEYDFSANPTSKYFDYQLADLYTSKTTGGEEMDFSFAGVGFFNYITKKIPVDPLVEHRTVDSAIYTLSAGSYEFALYNQVNSNSSTLGQEKPIYSNIDNGGVGLFGSRVHYNVSKNFSLPPAFLPVVVKYFIDNLAGCTTTQPLRFWNTSGTTSAADPNKCPVP